MTTCLRKSCSFVSFVNECICECTSFPFGFEGGVWDLVVLFPDHCPSFYLLSFCPPPRGLSALKERKCP